MRVQAHGPHVQRGGHAAHGHGVEALGVGDRDGRPHDRGAGQAAFHGGGFLDPHKFGSAIRHKASLPCRTAYRQRDTVYGMGDTAYGAGNEAAKGRTFTPALIRLSAVVILGVTMTILDTTIVNVAIRTLARDFHASVATIQWVATGYLLALSLVIPLSGWAVERFGVRRLWFGSLILFIAGSILSGAAWSAESLIAFRVLQGPPPA